MIRELVTQVVEKYGATLTFDKYMDSFWKYERQTAIITNFKSWIDKLNCQHDIEDALRKIHIDYTIIGEFNPDLCKIDWRATNE